jgi:hypothetical protein
MTASVNSITNISLVSDPMKRIFFYIYVFFPATLGPGVYSALIFWEVVGLERGPLSLVSTTEELLGIKVTAPV